MAVISNNILKNKKDASIFEDTYRRTITTIDAHGNKTKKKEEYPVKLASYPVTLTDVDQSKGFDKAYLGVQSKEGKYIVSIIKKYAN